MTLGFVKLFVDLQQLPNQEFPADPDPAPFMYATPGLSLPFHSLVRNAGAMSPVVE